MKIKSFFSVAFLSILLTACGNEAIPLGMNESELEGQNELTTLNLEDLAFWEIQEGTFLGVSIGQEISSLPNKWSKRVVKDGEGQLEAYFIKNENGDDIGYVLPHPNQVDKVGTIVITSAWAETKDGLGIGKTFGDLLAIAPDLEVFGSATENWITARVGGINYRFEVPTPTFEVDKNKVDPNTTIKQIFLREKI